MIEAVGHHYLPTFFRNCSRLLEDNGIMALQAITIADQAFDRHKRSADFIKRYIFPGSCIPSVTAIGNAITRSTDLRLVHLEDITAHYSRTLMEWRNRFLGRSIRFERWDFQSRSSGCGSSIFAIAEAGFTERYIGDVQMLFAKPMFRQSIYPN